jgi:hypothetical protein
VAKKRAQPMPDVTDPKPKVYGTTPTQVRLTDEDKADIEAIRSRFGLPSIASTLRYCVQSTKRVLAEMDKNQKLARPRKPKEDPE